MPKAGPIGVLPVDDRERQARRHRSGCCQIVAEIFQKTPIGSSTSRSTIEVIDTAPDAAVSGMPLEPGFLFSESLLQLAIPELLAQTGTSGRQFAHLLIRAHQEDAPQSLPGSRACGGEASAANKFPLQRRKTFFDIAKKHGAEDRVVRSTISFKDRRHRGDYQQTA